jgi:hypothetical protein
MPTGLKLQWTEEEDRELRRIYAMSRAGQSSAALRKLADRKGVKLERCRNRAATLGLSRVAGRHRRWTTVEDENLEAYAGRLPVRKIARILARTDEAIINRLHLRKLSGRVKDRGYMRTELAECLGLDIDTLRALLKRFPLEANLLGNFAEADLQLWVWDHLEDLELRKCNQAWLKAMLRRPA